MKFHRNVQPKYRDAIEEALDVILARGNAGHVETAREIAASDVEIRFVPLKKIGCSGVAGLKNALKTNARIDDEELSFREALGEAYICFADWTFDVAGQRGCQGTLVHEGLHACDFARIISSFSNSQIDPLGITDLSLYELERRAAIASAEYLVLVGEPDYINEGQQLCLVNMDDGGKPCVDMPGIEQRMQNGYGLNADNQGTMISSMLGIRPKGEGSMFSRLISMVT